METLTLTVRKRDGRIFVTLLDRGGGVLADDPVGQPLPLEAELEGIRKLIRDQATATAQIPVAGRRLGGLLMPDPIFRAWQKRAVAGATRTELDMDDVGEYAWETASVKERLFLNPSLPFFRRAAGTAPHAVSPWPLDVLVILGSQEDDLEKIGGNAELESIRQELRPFNRSIHLTILRQPNRTGIKDLLIDLHPHVLHFIGHGDENGLELVSGKSYATWTSAAVLTELNEAEFTPPLIYLNACRSVGGHAPDAKGFGLAGAFLSKGARAVVAMQADIDGASAAECARAFYRSLAAGKPVDVAIAAARAAVDRSLAANQAGISERRDAYLPALLVSGSPEDVLPAWRDLCRPPEKAFIEPPGLLKPTGVSLDTIVTQLVDHEGPRRLALRGLSRNLVIVHGKPDTGKSWLLGWCMDGWLRRDQPLRYVSMWAAKDWLHVVRTILQGDATLGQVGAPLDKALSLIEAAICTPRKGKGKPAWPEKKKPPIEETMKVFHDALLQESGNKGLLLVLDQFVGPTRLDLKTFDDLWKQWIEPLVLDGDGRVRVVLGLPPDYRENLVFAKEKVWDVPVKSVPQQEYADLLKELMIASRSAEYQAHKALLQKYIDDLRKAPPSAEEELTAAGLAENCAVFFKMAKLGIGKQ